MHLTAETNPEYRERTYTLVISDTDLQNMEMLNENDRFALAHFGRAEATVEERLMGLQILARNIQT